MTDSEPTPYSMRPWNETDNEVISPAENSTRVAPASYERHVREAHRLKSLVRQVKNWGIRQAAAA